MQYKIHEINLTFPETHALDVIKKLHKEGFEAYLVGGAVRDTILGITPKDFDVATNATPDELYHIFRNSRIIGKRFPIVHVIFGNEIIEVTTFRSGEITRHSQEGRIMRDNSFGSVEQDATRRDFTCNSLYYDPINYKLLDFNQGLNHTQNRQLVIIGEPKSRYQEDPVRILRAIRLSVKLGFEIEKQTAHAIHDCAHLLINEPTSRLFDEALKILGSGYAEKCLKELDNFNIYKLNSQKIFSLFKYYQSPVAQLALNKTDQRLQNQQSISMGFVLAALVWQSIEIKWHHFQKNGESPAQAMVFAAKTLRETIENTWNIPLHFATTMRDIWAMQPLLLMRRGSRPFRLLSNPRFRAGYDFLLIRAESDKNNQELQELADWWTKFYHADDETRQAMSEEIMRQPNPHQSTKKSPKKKRRSKSKNKTNQNNPE